MKQRERFQNSPHRFGQILEHAVLGDSFTAWENERVLVS